MPVGRKKGERKKEKATRSVAQEAVKQLPKRHQKEILFPIHPLARKTL